MVDAFNAHDVDASLAHFADDFELTLRPAFPHMSDRTTRGKTSEWVRQLIDGDFRIEIEVLKVEGNRVRTLTCTWHNITRRIGLAPVLGIEDYVVKDGKIISLVWTSSDATRAKFIAIRTRFLTSVVIMLLGLTVLLYLLIR